MQVAMLSTLDKCLHKQCKSPNSICFKASSQGICAYTCLCHALSSCHTTWPSSTRLCSPPLSLASVGSIVSRCVCVYVPVSLFLAHSLCLLLALSVSLALALSVSLALALTFSHFLHTLTHILTHKYWCGRSLRPHVHGMYTACTRHAHKKTLCMISLL